MFEHGNQFIVANFKLIKLINKFQRAVKSHQANQISITMNKQDTLASRMGIAIDLNDSKNADTVKQHCVDILEQMLDNIPNNLSLAEAKELLIVDYTLDLPNKKYANRKATGKFGLADVLCEANAIIANIDDNNQFNNVSDAFNYLDLVDGDYLDKNDIDAVYFNSTRKLATVGDVFKEYQHGIKFLNNLTKNYDHVDVVEK